jgi:hypothetical protein
MALVTHSMVGSGATVRVLYPRYHRPSVTAQQIWIWPSSLQWQMIGEPSTLYQIWSQLTWLRGGTTLKVTKQGCDLYRSFLSHLNSHGQAGSCHLSAQTNYSLCPSSAHARYTDSFAWESPILGKQQRSRRPQTSWSFNARQDRT